MATITTASQSTIPGPRALFGWHATALALYHTPFASLRHLHATYGDVVALAHNDPFHVFAFGPKLNRSILIHPEFFEARSTPSSLHKYVQQTALGRLSTKNLLTLNGSAHTYERQLMQPVFQKQRIDGYYGDIVLLTQQMLEGWRERSEVDLFLEMQCLMQQVIVKEFFGAADATHGERIGNLQEKAMMLLSQIIKLPTNLFAFYRELCLAEQIEVLLSDLLVQKRAQRDPQVTDMLSIFLAGAYQDGREPTNEEIIGHTFNFLVAGYRGRVTALTWTIFLLSQHPPICADLLDELDATLHGAAPTREQLAGLPLLERVVKESLRLLPPAVTLSRMTAVPCDLGGFKLPKDARVTYSPFVTHHLPELYTQPNHFLPERWERIERSPYEYLPFDAGRHRCIGAELALQEIKVVLALLLQRYRLTLLPNRRITANLRMRPLHGMPMFLFPQDRQFQYVPVRGNIHQLVDFGNH
jgi:cytochrome P450